MKRKQEKENKLRDVYNYINDNKIMTQHVQWNAKNKERDEANKYNLQKKKFEKQQEIFLDMRRKKLSELFKIFKRSNICTLGEPNAISSAKEKLIANKKYL